MDAKKITEVLLKSAKLYSQNLVNKKIMIIFEKDKNLSYIEVIFKSSNFKHLTGIESQTKPNSFYRKCIAETVAKSDIGLKRDGTTEMKLSVLVSVLEYSMNFLNFARDVSDYDGYALNFRADMVVGNNIVTFGLVRNNNHFSPNSLLKQDIRKVTSSPKYKIKAILSKNLGDDLYTVEHLTQKRVKISALHINSSSEIGIKIGKNLL